jgi:hypothetical protein
MNPKLRALVIISDLHLGSDESILQPDFVTEKNQPIGQTPIAKWLYECWQIGHQWLSGVVNPKEYALILNGDMIEGNHHRTTEIWSPDTRNHAKAAKELLAPVARRAGKIFMVAGTECHVGGTELSIGKDLGAEVNPETGQPIWQHLCLDIAGVRVSVRHHFPATSRSYLEASQYSIQLGNAVNEAVRAGDVAPRVLIGAHRHRTGYFVDGNRLAAVTGAWQGLTRHGHKVVPDGRPCPSIICLDWREKEDGELPAVHCHKFNPPAVRAVSL